MSPATGADVKTERLLNLVIALLHTRRPLTKARIRQAVPQYQESSAEAFDRMFERDKDELRDLGIPLRTESVSHVFEDDLGYRIDRSEYALPDIAFEPDELAVLGLASRAWSQATLAGPAAQALRKLESGGSERDDAAVAGMESLLRTPDPAFESVRAAVQARTPITFAYRKAGEQVIDQRRVQPWRLSSWRGRWYLTGYDLDRAAERIFRLSRVQGTATALRGDDATSYDVPEDHDPYASIRRNAREEGPHDAAPTECAVIRVRDGCGPTLRRHAESAEVLDGGWTLLSVPYHRQRWVVDQVTALGADALVEGPPALREAVVQRLQGVLDAHTDQDGVPA